jgi:SSS family solute:Na+ symporter
LKIIDWIIVAAYFAFVIWLGSRFARRQTSSDRYFLGNRSLPGWAVGMSIFATIISSLSFLALPGKAFKDDLQYLVTIASVPIAAIIATSFIIPLFRQTIKLSAYEYLEKRFGLLARFYGNSIFLITNYFKMSLVLYLLCLAIAGITGWNLYVLILLVGLATTTYTFFGGIEGVVWTDVTQGILLLGGGVISLLLMLFHSPAAPSEILTTAYNAGKFKLVSLDFQWSQVSVYVLLCFGFSLYMTRYGTDQTVVQRYLLSSSTRQARRSLWVSAIFLCVVWLVFMFIGVLLWVYYDLQPGLLPDHVRARPDQVFAYFIGHELPSGVAGMILAGLFAASMSTLSSDLNSIASVLVDDFYNKIAKSSDDKWRLLFSRISVLVIGFLSIFLALGLTRFTSMVEVFFVFSSVIAGGMMAMFFLGLFTRRGSRKGLYVGLAVGVVFIAWAALTNPSKADNWLPEWLPRFRIHIYWLGLVSNILVFAVGYLASRVLSRGYSAETALTVYGKDSAQVGRQQNP